MPLHAGDGAGIAADAAALINEETELGHLNSP
jgi:hypothetical protein